MRLFVDCRTLRGQAMGALLVLAPTLPLGFDNGDNVGEHESFELFPKARARGPLELGWVGPWGAGRCMHAMTRGQHPLIL
jgi:hypothetical protein